MDPIGLLILPVAWSRGSFSLLSTLAHPVKDWRNLSLRMMLYEFLEGMVLHQVNCDIYAE